MSTKITRGRFKTNPKRQRGRPSLALRVSEGSFETVSTQPLPTPPIGLSSKLEYDLSAEDFVACWRFLARESPNHLPPSVSRTLLDPVIVIHFGIAVALLFGALASLSFGSEGVTKIICLVAVLDLLFGLGSAQARPGLYLDGFLAKPFRWACMASLRSLAQEQAKKGRTALLDIFSHYGFAMNRGGFTHEAEYQQRFGRNSVILRRRQDKIAWRVVEVAGSTEQHMFFVMCDSIPVIVPRTCFADDSSFHEFAQTAIRYRNTRFNMPGSQAVMPGPENRFGPRPI